MALALSVTLGTSTQLHAQTLTWLGTLGTGYSEAYGVSADGTVVVGWAGISGPHIAFRWTPSTGMQDIGSLAPGRDTEAWGLSANGQVIVGYGFIGSTYRGFRWENGTFTQIDTFGGNTSWALGANQDGRVIVGAATLSDGFNRAFRWENGTMENLGTLAGAIRSMARAVSDDGNVVVGWSGYANTVHHAFRWTRETGMVSLHNPAFGQSEGLGVSGDGNVVVGAWGDASFTPARPFRWTASTGMVDMGTLGGQWGEAWDANYDGTIIVGWSDTDPGVTSKWAAFRWTPAGGMEDLNETYASLLTDGSILYAATAISPNGRYIVGYGYNAATGNTEAYLLDTLSRIRGNIVLKDFAGDVSQVPVTVELRGAVPRTLTIYPEANGDYTIPDVLPGTYDIAFKASHWLRVVVQDVEVFGEEATGVDAALTNGDIDGDNEVTLFDFGALVAAFGSIPGDSNWNADADLDGDEEVTLFDFGVLVRNLGAIGDD